MSKYTEAEVLNAIKTMGLFKTPYPHDVVTTVVFNVLKKHTPTKPYWVYDDEPLCPYCHCVVEEYEEVCRECTQLIDWRDTE